MSASAVSSSGSVSRRGEDDDRDDDRDGHGEGGWFDDVRSRLRGKAGRTSPLFDTGRWVRNLEIGLRRVVLAGEEEEEEVKGEGKGGGKGEGEGVISSSYRRRRR